MQRTDNLAYDNRLYGYDTAADESAILVYSPAYYLPARLATAKKNRVYIVVKRLADFVMAAVALIVLFPLFLLTAIAIKLDSKGPVFFVHERVGQSGNKIKVLKFRSMVSNARQLQLSFTPEQEAQFQENFKLEHDSRVTRIGRYLRRFSLDELPQLVNILLGDLSFVGPRPVIEEELTKYGYRSTALLSVKPGLTGYWQVNGRSATTYEQRMQMELYYVKKRSLWLDFKILLKTVPAVLTGRGAK